jgi:hypothetical protein
MTSPDGRPPRLRLRPSGAAGKHQCRSIRTVGYDSKAGGGCPGILILSNRGSNNAGARIGRRIMLGLVALSSAEAQRTGTRN